MSWKSECLPCRSGMFVVMTLAIGVGLVHANPLDEAWVRVQEVEQEIAVKNGQLENSVRALKSACVLPCGYEITEALAELRDASTKLDMMLERKAAPAEMAPLRERIRIRSEFLTAIEREAERRSKMGLNVETLSEEIDKLKRRLGDLELERAALDRMLSAGGRKMTP